MTEGQTQGSGSQRATMPLQPKVSSGMLELPISPWALLARIPVNSTEVNDGREESLGILFFCICHILVAICLSKVSLTPWCFCGKQFYTADHYTLESSPKAIANC